MKKRLALLTLTALTLPATAADKPLRIGIEGAYPPFSEVNAAGKLVGFDVDISKALCKQMQRDCQLVQIAWDGLIPALKTRKIDAIVASMSATPERKKSVDFTDKYYSSYGRIVAPAKLARTITKDNLEDTLKNHVIGVQVSTNHDRYATDKLAGKVGGIRRYQSQDEANLDMQAGRIDLTLADQIAMLTGFLNTDAGKQYAFAVPVFDDPTYYGDGISIAVRKGDDSLRDAFNHAIKAIRDNGTYKTINDRYFSEDIY